MAFSKTDALTHLRRAHEKNRLAHAYLISGRDAALTREVTAALASLVNHCPPETSLQQPDVHLAEPESRSRRITVEQVRNLERELQMRSLTGSRKIAIIAEADRLIPAAANAFLKTLEEPPANSLLVLTTCHPEMLLDTIISRCIPLPLLADGKAPMTEAQRALCGSLEEFQRAPAAGVGEVFRLVRSLQSLLAEIKEAIQATHAEELKREQDQYAKTTDGKWLGDRENYYKALSESQYIGQRQLLIDTLMQWMADALRISQGVARLDLPNDAATTAHFAARTTPADLLRRISEIEHLRELLGTNVNEALALETSFLAAFVDR